MTSGSLSARSLSIGYLRRGGLDIPVTDLMVDAGNLVLEYREIILNRFLVNMLLAFKSPQSLPHPTYEIEKNFLRSTYK